MPEPKDPSNPSPDPATVAAAAEETNKLSSETKNAAQNMSKLIEYIGSYEMRMKQIARQMKEVEASMKNIENSGKTLSELEFNRLELQEDQLKILEEISEDIEKKEEFNKKLLATGQQIKQQDLDELENLKKQKQEYEKLLKLEGKSLEAAKNQNQQLKFQKQSQVEFGKMYANHITQLTGISGHAESIAGKFAQMALSGVPMGGALAATGEEMRKLISFTNLAVLGLDKLSQLSKFVLQNSIAMAKEQDKVFANFQRQAGNVGIYEKSILSSTAQNVKFGATVAEMGNSFAAAKNSISTFEKMTQSEQKALGETTFQMERLGIATETTGEINKYLIKSLGQTGDQAAKFSKQLYATAIAMGLPPAKVTKEFAAAIPRLSMYGKDMEKVFLGLQKTSQETGIEMSKLTKMAEKFDTFEGAAEAVGKLNAMLGTDLFNAVELSLMQDDEKINYIRERLRLSGLELGAMTQEQKKLIAREAGLESAAELEAAINNEIEKGSIAMIEKQKAEKEAAEALKKATEVGQMWNALLQQITIQTRPLVNILKEYLIPAIEWVSNILSKEPGIAWGVFITAMVIKIGFWIAAISKAVMASKALKLGLELLSATQKAQSSAMAAQSAAATSAAAPTAALGAAQTEVAASNTAVAGTAPAAVGGMTTTGNAARLSAGSIAAFGLAVLGIGVGIGAAAHGLAELVKSFNNLTNAGYALAAVGAVLVGFGVIIAILGHFVAVAGVEFAVAAPGILAFGAAIALIGLGVDLAAGGVAKLVESFKGLGDAAPALQGLLYFMIGMSVIMVPFAIAVSVLGANLAIAAPGLLAFGAAAALIGVGIGIAAAAIGYMTKNIGDMFSAINKVDPITIAGNIGTFFESISLTRIALLYKFSDAANNLNTSLKNMKENIQNNVEYINKFYESISKLSSVTNINIPSFKATIDSDIEKINKLTAALSKPINSTIVETLKQISEILNDMSSFKLATLSAIVAFESASPTKAAINAPSMPATTTGTSRTVPATVAVATINTSNTTIVNNANNQNSVSGAEPKTKILPVSIHIDGKLLGRITEDKVKEMIDDIAYPGIMRY